MKTLYDIYITTKGFFNALGRRMHVPGTVTGLESNELDIIESLGWQFNILREYEAPESAEVIFASGIRRFICQTEADVEKIRGIRNNDEVLILDSGKLFIYIE